VFARGRNKREYGSYDLVPYGIILYHETLTRSKGCNGWQFGIQL